MSIMLLVIWNCLVSCSHAVQTKSQKALIFLITKETFLPVSLCWWPSALWPLAVLNLGVPGPGYLVNRKETHELSLNLSLFPLQPGPQKTDLVHRKSPAPVGPHSSPKSSLVVFLHSCQCWLLEGIHIPVSASLFAGRASSGAPRGKQKLRKTPQAFCLCLDVLSQSPAWTSS